MVGKFSRRHFELCFPLFPKNRICHFMQKKKKKKMFPLEISNPNFRKKKIRKKKVLLLSAEFTLRLRRVNWNISLVPQRIYHSLYRNTKIPDRAFVVELGKLGTDTSDGQSAAVRLRQMLVSGWYKSKTLHTGLLTANALKNSLSQLTHSLLPGKS